MTDNLEAVLKNLIMFNYGSDLPGQAEYKLFCTRSFHNHYFKPMLHRDFFKTTENGKKLGFGIDGQNLRGEFDYEGDGSVYTFKNYTFPSLGKINIVITNYFKIEKV